jgi:hypothetical protein
VSSLPHLEYGCKNITSATNFALQENLQNCTSDNDADVTLIERRCKRSVRRIPYNTRGLTVMTLVTLEYGPSL